MEASYPPIRHTRRWVPSQDLHLHSTYSFDGASTLDAHCLRAIELGIREIGFAEHVEFDPRDRRFGFFDAGRYLEDVDLARARYGRELTVRVGVELPYHPAFADDLRDFIARWPFDFVIGAVHVVEDADGWGNLSNVRDAAAWFHSRSEADAYRPYFQAVGRAAQSGLFDVLAHLDVAKAFGVTFYGPFRWEEYAGDIEPILTAAVEHGTAIEVNTAGLFDPVAMPYPDPAILARYRELGGERVTLGSDAYHVNRLGAGLEHGLAWIERAGFAALTTFTQREPERVPLWSPQDTAADDGMQPQAKPQPYL